MAVLINMQHPQTGIIRPGYYGFSWTTLFFGGFPALFRGDAVTALAVSVFSVCTFGAAQVIWAFIYNRTYTLSPLEKGYVFHDAGQEKLYAELSLGIDKD
ncbi:MAG: hypothetical protein LBR29_03235 [Methylobacteriaceae bacterium]|jgi:hypothetical protein|nr:hypothetical protein [Methylobacteriaceae bacterium]